MSPVRKHVKIAGRTFCARTPGTTTQDGEKPLAAGYKNMPIFASYYGDVFWHSSWTAVSVGLRQFCCPLGFPTPAKRPRRPDPGIDRLRHRCLDQSSGTDDISAERA